MVEKVLGVADEQAGGDAFSVDFKGRGADVVAGLLECYSEAQSSAS